MKTESLKPKWEYRPLNTDFGDVVYHNSELLPDAKWGTSRVVEAIMTEELIWIFGDYDSDGIRSSHIYSTAIKDCGGQVKVRIPERLEGYGVKPLHVEEARQQGAKLLILIDNGSSAYDAINRANEIQLDVIIIDHHNVTDEELNVLAFINPKRPMSIYPCKDLCAAYLAMKMAGLLYNSFGFPKGYAEEKFLDTAAVGTIGDMMPLIGENRRLVIDGLHKLNQYPNRYEKALRFALMTPTKMSARDVAFSIVPVINAASRLGNAKLSQNFFEAQDREKIAEIALELKEANDMRRDLKEEWAQKVSIITAADTPIIWAHHDDLPIGLLGLVAAVIGQEHQKPSIVTCKVTDAEGHIHFKGSGRSIPEFAIYDYIMQIPDEWFEARGGHDAAIGLTVKDGCLDDVLHWIIHNPAQIIPQTTKYYSDILNYVEQQWEAQLSLEPYGTGHPQPIYLVPDLYVSSVRNYSGTRHGKGLFNGKEIGFKTDLEITKGIKIRALGTIERDTKGIPRLTLSSIERSEE